ncbi:MAG: sulfate ABC transporter ATP-binding protein, partial [Nitrospirota bacterium]
MIEIAGITKAYGGQTVLKDINLTVPTGGLMALLGPSGCGKTTLLRIISGLETADNGMVKFQGEDAAGQSAKNRNVGFVFQHYALFRHMTVFENVAFGLRVRPRKLRPSKKDISKRVHSLLDLVQLDNLHDRYPSQLSGGQRQRVALARALAVEPKVLLLDEPFGALDARVRQELRRWLRRLHDEIRLTSVFVTHDQEEALEVADQVAVMNEGRIEQVGSPEDVYEHPNSPFVYNFLGDVNLFHGSLLNGTVAMGDYELAAPEHIGADADAVGYVRLHDFDVSLCPSGLPEIGAVVSRSRALGATVRLELKRRDTGEPFEAEMSLERFREL